MSTAPHGLSDRARAIVEAAEEAARAGRGDRPAAERTPVPRRPAPAALRAVQPPSAAPADVTAIPDPERLLALIQRIAVQAAEVRRRLDALSEEVARREAEAPAPQPAPTDAPQDAPLPGPTDAAPDDTGADVAAAPVAAERPAPAPHGETARLVAIEMAVGGASRAEVRSRLTDEFGIREVEGLLDEVYGRA
ncbi:hypothetical protein [Paraconexibacter algicola]|uniref:hypothetical protein n=1 Tax=Paraconexibacter algicola TaxID=2133960 RepID=UPI001304DF4C|nr:hypothetical protein [Paraconexibacter algicola]